MIVMNILGGCSLIWTDDIFLCTWFKEVDAANIEMISEPNYLQMGSGILRSKSKSIKIVTPSGTIGIGD